MLGVNTPAELSGVLSMDYHAPVKPEPLNIPGIHCPSCGVQAPETDLNFCRTCGAELTLAMEGQTTWPRLPTRFNKFISSKRQYARKHGWNLIALGVGIGVIPMIIWGLVTEHGPPQFWGVLTAVSFVALNMGIGKVRLHLPYIFGNSPPAFKKLKTDFATGRIDQGNTRADGLALDPKSDVASSAKTTELLECDESKTTQTVPEGAAKLTTTGGGTHTVFPETTVDEEVSCAAANNLDGRNEDRNGSSIS